VLLDSPPALGVTDASVLATRAAALLSVTRARHTRTPQLRATVEALAPSGRPIAGVIVNRVASRDAYYYESRGDAAEAPDRVAAAAVRHDAGSEDVRDVEPDVDTPTRPS
jgi:succinoglycan biosynthesis transport protein ExoP